MPVMSCLASRSVALSEVVLCDVMPGQRPSVCAAGMAGPLGWERRVRGESSGLRLPVPVAQTCCPSSTAPARAGGGQWGAYLVLLT
jgi:hypothetical protein